jgi:hypothetical protein
MPKIKSIYNPKLVEIKYIISDIKKEHFIEKAKGTPIEPSKYRSYLDSCY